MTRYPCTSPGVVPPDLAVALLIVAPGRLVPLEKELTPLLTQRQYKSNLIVSLNIREHIENKGVYVSVA